ncbi:MAG: site-2 protease family protein [Acidimicrobiia bacterium]|nr:site-2 protease family protein [Acidimicrobiia bacterium]
MRAGEAVGASRGRGSGREERVRDPLEAYEVDRRRAVLVVALVTAGSIALAIARPTVFGTILVILGFFVMIMLHELGHFVMAKRSGMKVTEFFVGFGPRIWSVRPRRDRVRPEGAAARWLLQDHRDDEPRGGRPGR